MLLRARTGTITVCWACSAKRPFSVSAQRADVRPLSELPERVHPEYTQSKGTKKISLRWPRPPRNIMFIKKPGVDVVRDALVECAEHITTTYPGTNIILEPTVAASLQHRLSKPVYTLPPSTRSTPFPFTQSTYPRTPPHPFHVPSSPSRPSQAPPGEEAFPSPVSFSALESETSPYHAKADFLVTLGGDGTILYAASLFSTSRHVPPVLTFSMGTLGFLGEFSYRAYASAFASTLSPSSTPAILQRNRLKAGIFDTATNARVPGEWGEYEGMEDAHAMNELSLHRGMDPHLIVLEIFVGEQFLTEAVADGIIVATPTGSTAYSLSSGGSILHPAVPSLLITPICPRSLSFRPLVLPEDRMITLKLSEKNRGREVCVSVDGRRWGAVGLRQEVRVWLESVKVGEGGIPCIVSERKGREDGWVGGLNGLLKFNYPFGEE